MSISVMSFEKRQSLDELRSKYSAYRDIFFVNGSFGDILLQLSLLSDADVELRQQSCVLIHQKHQLLVTKFLNGRLPFDLLTDHGYEFLMSMFMFCPDEFHLSKSGIKALLPTINKNIGELISARYLTLLDALLFTMNRKNRPRQLNYSFSESDYLTAKEYLCSVGVRPSKTVILCPFNNTVHSHSTSFYSVLAQELRNIGWDVVTNIHPTNQCLSPQPIDDTIGLNIPGEACIEVIEACGGILGGNNGMISSAALFGRSAIIASIRERSLVTYTGSQEHEMTSLSLDYPGININPRYHEIYSTEVRKIVNIFSYST